jgi:hypothetical protein
MRVLVVLSAASSVLSGCAVAVLVLVLSACTPGTGLPSGSATVSGYGVTVTEHGPWVPNPAPTTYNYYIVGCGADASVDVGGDVFDRRF